MAREVPTVTFHLREHTADVAVEATGETLGDAFASAGNGMAAAMCEDVPSGGDRYHISVRAEGQQALLFDYLDELIYERDVRAVLPVDNDATVVSKGDAWQLEATYRGVPLSTVVARDLKAVTYSDMDVSQTDRGWHVYVVFDV